MIKITNVSVLNVENAIRGRIESLPYSQLITGEEKINRDKQIEEIDNLTSVIWEANHKKSVLDYHWLATEIHTAGYRKASEVALEAIRKMEQIVEVKIIGIEEDFFHNTALYGDARKKDAFEEILVELAELKKKYTEGEG